MSESDFDTALIAAAFRIAADEGWSRVGVVAAARLAGLSLSEARTRFPSRGAILLRFGQMVDQAALDGAPNDGPVKDRLFDLLMRRYDALQPHRAGIKALVRALPMDPPLALMLHMATYRSMRWMLETAGVNAQGPRGDLQMRGLTALWYWGLRTWERDESEDLSSTMATVDDALNRADRVASWLHGRTPSTAPQPEADVSTVDEVDPTIDSALGGDTPLPDASV